MNVISPQANRKSQRKKNTDKNKLGVFTYKKQTKEAKTVREMKFGSFAYKKPGKEEKQKN